MLASPTQQSRVLPNSAHRTASHCSPIIRATASPTSTSRTPTAMRNSISALGTTPSGTIRSASNLPHLPRHAASSCKWCESTIISVSAKDATLGSPEPSESRAIASNPRLRFSHGVVIDSTFIDPRGGSTCRYSHRRLGCRRAIGRRREGGCLTRRTYRKLSPRRRPPRGRPNRSRGRGQPPTGRHHVRRCPGRPR